MNKVVAEGTRFVFDGSSYSRKMTVKAYAYTGGGRTAMGTQARVGEIAVDPSVIPLGTTVYIEGVGERRAEDTGGNIKGNTIDIYMNSEAECRIKVENGIFVDTIGGYPVPGQREKSFRFMLVKEGKEWKIRMANLPRSEK